jgi:hypothetical protein
MTTPIEYVTVPNYPHLRAAIHPDHDPLNPLDNWDHGIQFVTLPSAGRTWSDYAEPHGNGIAIDMYPEKFAEFAGEYQDSRSAAISTPIPPRGSSFAAMDTPESSTRTTPETSTSRKRTPSPT